MTAQRPQKRGPGKPPAGTPEDLKARIAELEGSPARREKPGRLTIDVDKALHRDLKAWVARYDGTLADVIRALAKLTLTADDTAGQRECQTAILEEIKERQRRESAARRSPGAARPAPPL